MATTTFSLQQQQQHRQLPFPSFQDADEVSAEIMMMIIEECPPYVLAKLSQTCQQLFSMCFLPQIWRRQISNIFHMAGIMMDENFETQLKNSQLSYYEITKEWGGPYVRWSNVLVVSDETIILKKPIHRVMLPKDMSIRIKVDSGFETYMKQTNCWFSTRLHFALKEDYEIKEKDILYSDKHVLVWLPKHSNGWCLVDYSNEGNELRVLSMMPKLNGYALNKEKGCEAPIDFVSGDQHLLILCPGKIFLYNWIKDQILGDYDIPKHFTKVQADFSSAGTIKRVIMKDAIGRIFMVMDMITLDTFELNVGKNCNSIIPMFRKQQMWTLDGKGIQNCFSLIDGSPIYKSDKPLYINRQAVKSAFYAESLQRMIIVNEQGDTEVGEMNGCGAFLRCGTLEPQDVSVSSATPRFSVESIVSGPNSIALVGKNHIRHIHFEM